MADPPHFSLFQQRFLTGDNPLLRLDDEFLRNHTKVILRSNASCKVWKVKLDGDRLADGWEVFAADLKLKDGDVLDFRHNGDEIFHVSVSSRSDSGDIQHASPSDVDTEDGDIDDDDVDATDDDDEDGVGEKCCVSVKKTKKAEADSSSCFITASITRYSLAHDRLDLSRNFTMSFGEHTKSCDIDLVNEQGRKWTLVLTKNSSSGVFYIRRGWTNFCSVNKLSEGDHCKFKKVENGEKPVLLLCPQDAVKSGSAGGCRNEKSSLDEVSKGKEKKTPSPFLTLKYTASRDSTGQLSLPPCFTRENGINKPGDIILLNKDGRRWPSYLQITGCGGRGNEWFYLRRGWRELCEANGVKINDSFVMELIWEDANPMLKFCYKIENNENKSKGNTTTRKKRACETPMVEIQGPASKRVSRRPEKKGRTRVSNKTTTNSRKLQPPNSCSVSDQLANVKQGIVDTLKTARQFRAELKIREQNLEASLQEIEALGERIMGINKILN